VIVAPSELSSIILVNNSFNNIECVSSFFMAQTEKEIVIEIPSVMIITVNWRLRKDFVSMRAYHPRKRKRFRLLLFHLFIPYEHQTPFSFE
jgi:hypothetical protein